MRLALTLLILLQACAAFGIVACPVSGTSTPPVSESTLRLSWAARFGELPSKCDAHWAWSVVTPDEQSRVCLASAFAACTIYPSGCPLTLTTAAYASDTQLAAHEFAHAMLKCSTGDGDPAHTNTAVWGVNGFVEGFAKQE